MSCTRNCQIKLLRGDHDLQEWRINPHCSMKIRSAHSTGEKSFIGFHSKRCLSRSKNLIIVIIIVGHLACAQSNSISSQYSEKSCPPEWYMNVPAESAEKGYAVAMESSKDMNLAVTAAKRRAQGDVAAAMETYIGTETASIVQEIEKSGTDSVQFDQRFINLQKTIVRVKVAGLRTENQKVCENKDSGRFDAFVLVSYPRKALVESLITAVEADSLLNDFLKDKASYQSLKSN